MISSQHLPIDIIPCLYLCGIIASNDATSPNTVLDITAGQCRDSQNKIDIVIPNGLTVNFAINGPGGLDTGTVAVSTMYSIFAIADSSRKKNPSVMASLSNPFSLVPTFPKMPYGYDSYRLVGYWPTDVSGNLLKGYTSGFSNNRQFIYSTPYQTNVAIGNATTYTAVNLTNFIPNVSGTKVGILSILVPNAAGDSIYLTYDPTGDQLISNAPTTQHYYDYNNLTAVLSNINLISIYYKVTSSSDSVSLLVTKFFYSI